MQLTQEFLQILQQKLKVGTRGNIHLNAIGKRTKTKVDLSQLALIDDSYSRRFLEMLLTKGNFSFPIKMSGKTSTELSALSKKLDKIHSGVKSIDQEKGLNTFGFGYPLLVRKAKDNKLIIATLVIWTLKIRITVSSET